jgi:hypothetical protein
MEIKNFTGTAIALGEFPYSVVVQNVPGCHSDDGIVCDFFTCPAPSGGQPPRIVITRDERLNRIRIAVARYEFIPEGEIIYDSAGVVG